MFAVIKHFTRFTSLTWKLSISTTPPLAIFMKLSLAKILLTLKEDRVMKSD